MRPFLSYFVSTATSDILNFSFFSIVLVSLALRLTFRKWIVPAPGSDDIYIIFACLFGLGYIIVMHFEMAAYENVYNVLNRQPVKVQDTYAYVFNRYTLKQYAIALNLTFWDNFTQTISVTLAKLAFIAFYRRLTQIRSHRIALRVIDAILIANCISNVLVFVGTSSPVDCFFHLDKYDGGATCKWNINPVKAFAASAVVQIVVDLLLAGLPWIVLWNMQITLADRLKLVLIYSVGLTSLACSAARLWSFDTVSIRFMDVLRSQFIFSFTTMLEAFAAILCANIPILAGGFIRLQKRTPNRDNLHVYQNYPASDDPTVASNSHPNSRSGSIQKQESIQKPDPYDLEANQFRFHW